jgi:hypothetical protein
MPRGAEVQRGHRLIQPVRDRPGRVSPRNSKKASDFPARKPGEPSVINVTRRVEFHLLYSRQVT